MKASRREFVQAGSAALVGLSIKSDRPIAGSFVNDSLQIGHLLRDRAAFPAAQRVEKFPVVIVGGGIAGLQRGLAPQQAAASQISCSSK